MDTLIGRQTDITGDVSFAGGLHVDGRIKGNVTAASDKSSSLSVSEGGVIEGTVKVSSMVVNGRIVGEVWAKERLILGAKARIVGNVHYRILQMEAGALVNGQLIYEGSESVTAITHIKGDADTKNAKAA